MAEDASKKAALCAAFLLLFIPTNDARRYEKAPAPMDFR